MSARSRRPPRPPAPALRPPAGRWVGCLFVDMNSFFASAEQHLRPELRGRPVGVTPVSAETTCLIAASVEAKRFGVKTGTPVHESRRRCPGLRVVMARPHRYVELHHEIVAAVGSVVPVEAVESIDEMNCRLTGSQRHVPAAIELAGAVKRAIQQIGPDLRCSIGLAPNRLLAKTAGGMRKPDGLTVLTPDRLPHALYGLELEDLPGIGPRMAKRLRHAGLGTVRELCAAPAGTLRDVWGGVVGVRWWHWLRGEEVALPAVKTRSLGHSHVLPPPLRTDEGTYAVLCRLIHKAAARMRRAGLTARRMDVEIGLVGRPGAWRATAELNFCRDTQTPLAALARVWPGRPRGGTPLKVAVTLHKLAADAALPRSLFPEDRRRERLAAAMDGVNAAFGVDAVYFACMHPARRTAPMRIAFGRIPTEEEGEAEDYAADPEAAAGRARSTTTRTSSAWSTGLLR